MIKIILISSLLAISIIKSAALPEQTTHELAKLRLSYNFAQVRHFWEELGDFYKKLAENHNWNQLLVTAIKNNNFKYTKLAIDNGADITTSIHFDGDIGNALHVISYHHGDIKILKLLIEANADPNIKSQQNKTPLMYAVISSDFKIAKFLIENKADINANDGNSSILHYAARSHQNFEIMKLLLENGAFIETYNQDALTPLSILNGVIWRDDIRILLLKYGAKIHEPNNFFLNNKQYVNDVINAVLEDDSTKISKILKNNLQYLENYNNYLIWHAWQKFRGKTLTYYKFNSIDSADMTALMWAASRGNEQIVDLLLDYGRKTGLLNGAYENSEHETALILAQQRGHKKIAKDIYDYLLQHRINLAKLFRTKKLPLRVGSYLAEFIYGGNILKE